MQARTWSVSDLIAHLEPDAWRRDHPFSSEMANCHRTLFDPASSRVEKIAALSRWLAENQPCLFGQMEAKRNRLAFCLLTENDLEQSDQEICDTIQRERVDWKRHAFHGNSHGFLIVAVSETIAFARPGPLLLRLAKRLCELYLGRDEPDAILLDDLILEMNSPSGTEWRRWKVGANYFSAQGDRRWWCDHRMPGGLAFSMNSVGHMARTGAELALSKNPDLTSRCASLPREKLVYWALVNAMKTIGPLTDGSTRGTWLAKRGTFEKRIGNRHPLSSVSDILATSRISAKIGTRAITIRMKQFRRLTSTQACGVGKT